MAELDLTQMHDDLYAEITRSTDEDKKHDKAVADEATRAKAAEAANATDITELDARINNIVTPNGQASLQEVVDARMRKDATVAEASLKARLDKDYGVTIADMKTESFVGCKFTTGGTNQPNNRIRSERRYARKLVFKMDEPGYYIAIETRNHPTSIAQGSFVSEAPWTKTPAEIVSMDPGYTEAVVRKDDQSSFSELNELDGKAEIMYDDIMPLPKEQLSAYLPGPLYGEWENVNNYNAVKVTLPQSIRIIERGVSREYETAGGEYTFNPTEALYLNDDSTLEKAGQGTKDSINLFSSAGHGVMDGALAKYYYADQLRKLDERTMSTLYFSSGLMPTFGINGTNLDIILPICELRVYRQMHSTVSLVVTEETRIIHVADWPSCVVLDPKTKLFSVKIHGAVKEYEIVFASWNGTTVTGGLLQPYFDHWKNTLLDTDSAWLYFSNGLHPSFVIDGAHLTINLPICEMRVYNSKRALSTILKITDDNKSIKLDTYPCAAYFNINEKSFIVSDIPHQKQSGDYLLFASWNRTTVTGGLLQPYFDHWLEHGIIGLNKDSKTKILQSRKRKSATGEDGQPRRPILTLLHMADIHNHVENAGRIQQFKSYYSQCIDDVICTGDIVAGRFSDSINAISDNTDGTILTCIGNHDTLTASDGWDWTQVATQQEAYNKFIAPFASNWGADAHVQAGKTYYYKDYPENKVRLIVLNCMIRQEDEQDQLAWFEGILNDAITNSFDIVCAQHFPPYSPNAKGLNCTFTTKDNPIGTTATYPDRLTPMQEKVQSFIDSGGNFVCWLAGHTHYDVIAYNSQYPQQIFLIVTTAQIEEYWEEAARVKGDISQDAFNVVSFDTDSKLIKVVRVGQNYDRHMRHLGTLVLDYSKSPAEVLVND